MIEVRHVTKVYSGSARKAVDDVSFEIRPGEIFGFLGPNGAGKTTTIKMITGILPITDGKITVSNFDIRLQPTEAKRTIGYVQDGQVVYEKLTGREYVNFLGDLYGVSLKEREERVSKYLELFNLTKDFDQQISTYSYGMQQKIAIIGALISDPDNWILDEPMRGLDPQSTYELKVLMRERANAGKSVFFSTHVLDVAEKICDRVGIIAGGKMVAALTVEDLKARYGTDLERMFLSVTGAKLSTDKDEVKTAPRFDKGGGNA